METVDQDPDVDGFESCRVPDVTVSIVVHDGPHFLFDLLDRLKSLGSVSRIIVTVNVPETFDISWPDDEFVTIVRNPSPKGYSANHNAAFTLCDSPYFCVLNPDIVLGRDPFPVLVRGLENTDSAIAAPLIRSPSGVIEDSIRRFPTPLSLLLKLIDRSEGRYPLGSESTLFFPDWAAGMFLLFRSADFSALGGFDARFFLYYEDVDICARAWKAGKRVIACPGAEAIHAAQRRSRHDMRYRLFHLKSMLLFFGKHVWKKPRALPTALVPTP